MVVNVVDEWAEDGEEIEASQLVEGDSSLGSIRSKIENKHFRTKISIAYRLAVYSAGKKPESTDKNVKLDTVITRLVKLNRTVRKQRKYTEVQG